MNEVSLINGHMDGFKEGTIMTTQKLISDLRKLGKYSAYEPNYLLLAAERLEVLLNDNNHLQAENERLKEEINRLRIENTSSKKEALKSKVFEYVRNPNRIYTIMDFQDGEILRFNDYPEHPNALASGHYKFQGNDDIRLIHISEVKELSYDEIKSKAYKECIEDVKAYYRETRFAYNAENLCEELDDLLKEKIGENK